MIRRKKRRMTAMAIHPHCPYKRSVERNLIKHNAVNASDPDKTIPIINDGSGNLKLRRLKNWLNDIKCPSGYIDRRYINFSPGMVGYRAWLKGLYGRGKVLKSLKTKG